MAEKLIKCKIKKCFKTCLIFLNYEKISLILIGGGFSSEIIDLIEDVNKIEKKYIEIVGILDDHKNRINYKWGQNHRETQRRKTIKQKKFFINIFDRNTPL